MTLFPPSSLLSMENGRDSDLPLISSPSLSFLLLHVFFSEKTGMSCGK